MDPATQFGTADKNSRAIVFVIVLPHVSIAISDKVMLFSSLVLYDATKQKGKTT